jgi:hypothetical protein
MRNVTFHRLHQESTQRDEQWHRLADTISETADIFEMNYDGKQSFRLSLEVC